MQDRQKVNAPDKFQYVKNVYNDLIQLFHKALDILHFMIYIEGFMKKN